MWAAQHCSMLFSKTLNRLFDILIFYNFDTTVIESIDVVIVKVKPAVVEDNTFYERKSSQCFRKAG